MLSVVIRIYPPLSMKLGLAKNGTRANFEQTFEQGACIRDVISRLNALCPAFREIALNPETGLPAEGIVLAINDQIRNEPNSYDIPLKDRDSILFLPIHSGG